MKAVIRRAQPSDADGCARVHVDTWRSAYAGIVPNEHLAKLSYEKRAQEWYKRLSDTASASFSNVAESEGRIVGFATGGPERGGHPLYKGEIWGIYVLDAWQKQGIGRQLTVAVAEELQRRGFDSMLVWVLKDNPCRAFYERLGGTPAGEKEIVIGGKKLVEVAYGWSDVGAFNRKDKSGEILFDKSEGVPMFRAQVNESRFERFFMDTGSPCSILSPEAAVRAATGGNAATCVEARLCVGSMDFGSVQFKIHDPGPNRLDGLLGTRELLPYVVEMDFEACRLRLRRAPALSSGAASQMTIFRGRPIAQIRHHAHTLQFVLDTGSCVSWLFPRGQAALQELGDAVAVREPVRSAHTDSTTLFAKFLKDVSVGGLVLPPVKFLLAAPGQFGEDAPEDGILGTDVLSHGVAVFDFPGRRFQMITHRSSDGDPGKGEKR